MDETKQVVWKQHPKNGCVLVALEGTAAYDYFGAWDNTTALPETAQIVCRKMLEAGGTYVLWHPMDEDIPHYVTRGKIFSAERVTKRRGLQSQCHANAARWWLKHPKQYRITTGYGLSEDGMWRQHSFLTRANGSVIETTHVRKLYFGFPMTQSEAEEFVDNNY